MSLEVKKQKKLEKKAHKEERRKKEKEYEIALARLDAYKTELISTFYKSQDAFEKQLNYITAGALGLSVAFIKDIVTPLSMAKSKCLLEIGWILLVATLLTNCISHLIAARNSDKAIKEINDNNYEPEIINFRSKKMKTLNNITVMTMIVGIAIIMLFIALNILV